MSLSARLLKPEYVYRPGQILRRLRPPSGVVTLPWGLPIACDPAEEIGRAIHTLGVYDLPVTEALWRLTDPGDVAVDAGANIGYMTAVLAARAARVVSFEPHPAVFEELEANASRWGGSVEIHRCALTDSEGTVRLSEGEGFGENRGTARVAEAGGVEVAARRLDSVVGHADVLKLDVEGHELPALRGAGSLVGRVRDIVFEEHGAPPTPVTEYLSARGYRLFAVGQTLFRPTLLAPERRAARDWLPQSFVATLDAGRALSRFKPSGWLSLK